MYDGEQNTTVFRLSAKDGKEFAAMVKARRPAGTNYFSSMLSEEKLGESDPCTGTIQPGEFSLIFFTKAAKPKN